MFRFLKWLAIGCFLAIPAFGQMVASNSATGLSYTTVQAAINAATNNYTVYIYTNTTTALDIGGKTNLTITKSNGLPYNPRLTGTFSVSGIVVSNVIGLTISNLVIERWFNGIFHDTNAHSNTYAGLEVRSNTHVGIHISSKDQGNQILGNNIWSNEDAVWMFDLSANNILRSNAVSSNGRWGIFGQYSSNNFIEGNIFVSNYDYSVYIWGGTNNRLLNNQFLGQQWTTTGIQIAQNSVMNVVSNNILNGHFQGITIDNARNNVVVFNTLLSNINMGIYVTNQSISNIIGTNVMAGPGQNWGMRIMSGPNQNTFVSNRIVGHGWYGIESRDSSNNLFLENFIQNNSNYGVYNAYILYSSYGNRYIGNTIRGPIQGEGIHLDWDDTNVLVLSNIISDHRQNGLYAYRASNNLIAFNTFINNATNGILFETNANNNRVISNQFGGTNQSGIRINPFATNLTILTNFFNGGGNGILATSSTNSIFAMNHFANNQTGLMLQGKSYGNRVLSNRIVGSVFAGIHLSVGPTNNTFFSNSIVNAATNGVVLSGATNNIFIQNTITGNKVGVSNLANALTNRFSTNRIFLNAMTNFWSLTGAVAATNNFWGSRTFPDMLVSPVLVTNSPWINNLTGVNDDWTPPLAPGLTVASNLAAGGVRVSWPSNTATDFYSYNVWRSTNFAMEFSNLIDSERVGLLTSVAVTNYDDAPPTVGLYRYWVTVSDVNGNESWYSPGSNVNVASGFMVASNSVTGLTYGTLQAALDAGGAVPKTVTLLATNLTAGGALYSANVGAYITNHNITLRGGYNNLFNAVTGMTRLDGESFLSHVLVISNATNVVLENLEVVGGRAMGPGVTRQQGGGLWFYNVSSGRISNVLLSNNFAQGTGGAWYAYGITNMVHTNVSVIGNSATNHGGGVYLELFSGVTHAGVHTLNNSQNRGGAVAAVSGTGLVLAGTLATNRAAMSGGGAYLYGTRLSSLPAIIVSNHAAMNGGGIILDTSSNETISLSVYSNRSGQDGGGAFLLGVTRSSISGNLQGNAVDPSGYKGGGIAFQSCSMITNFADLRANTADFGGGASVEDFAMAGAISIQGNFLSNRSRTNGGGVYAEMMYASLGNEVNAVFHSNRADGEGGGLYGSTLQIPITAGMYSNSSLQSGGGIALVDASGVVLKLTAIGNNATLKGGGVDLKYGSALDITGVFVGNRANDQGGAIHMSNAVDVRLTNVSCSNNTVLNAASTGYGGGVLWASGVTNLSINGTFVSNRAFADGAVFHFRDGAVCTNIQITGTFVSNFADRGPILYGKGANSVRISNSYIGNNFSVNGGILHYYGGADNQILGNIITNGGLPDGTGIINLLSVVTALTISNNWIGGTNAGSGIFEVSGVSPKNLSYNTFETNRLTWIYSDFSAGSTNDIAAVNTAAYSGSTFAQGNTVFPPPSAGVAAVASNSTTGLGYATIQGAIDAATNGYTVTIYSNTSTAVTISGKTNVLISRGTGLSTLPILQGAGAGTAVNISDSQNVTFSFMSLRNWGGGIVITNSQGILVQSNEVLYSVSASGSGIQIAGPGSSGNIVEGNRIITNSGCGIGLFGFTYGNTIQSNLVADTATTYGIYLSQSSNNLVLGNEARSNLDRGIFVTGLGADRNRIVGNRAWGKNQYTGIYLDASIFSNEVTSNVLYDNQAYGMQVSWTSNNLVIGNVLYSNTTAGILLEGTDGVENLIQGNRINGPGQLYGIQFLTGARSNLLLNNVIYSNQTHGIFLSAGTLNRIVSNHFWGGGQANGIFVGGAKNQVLSNLFNGHAQKGIWVNGVAGNLLAWNRVVSNGNYGIFINNAKSNLIYSNHVEGGAQNFGMYFATNSMSNQIYTNRVEGNAIAGVVLDAGTNYLILNQILNNGVTGVSNNIAGSLILTNVISNSGVFNLFSGTAVGSFSNNHFGTRTFSNMKMAGPQGVEPWLNGNPGLNGDIVAPPPPVSLVASNGTGNLAWIHWGPASVASDFTNYSVFASTNTDSHSNLSDADIITSVSLSSLTNVSWNMPGSGTWNFWVTVKDTNRNESWYSSRGSVVLSPVSGDVASNSATSLGYATLQAAIDAATNNYTVTLYSNVSTGVTIQAKTNLTLVGSGNPKIIGSGAGTGISVDNSTGIELRLLSWSGWDKALHVHGGSANLVVASNQFLSNQTGAVISNAGALTLLGNRFSSNLGDGLVVTAVVTNFSIQSNTFEGNGANGFWMDGSNSFSIVSNRFISNAQVGLRISHGNGGVVGRNLIDGSSQYGVQMESPVTNVLFVHNTVARSLWHGLEIQGGGHVLSTNNLFWLNGQNGLNDGNFTADRHDYNLYFGNGWGNANVSLGANSVSGDPLLDPAIGFRPTNSASFAVDRGLSPVMFGSIWSGFGNDVGWAESSYVGKLSATNLTTGTPYLTISGALSAAGSGDTVAIFEGKYDFHSFILDKNLTVKAYPFVTNGNQAAVILDGGFASSFVFKVTNNVTVNLHGISFTNSGMGGFGAVLYEQGAQGTLLSNRILSGMNYGLKIKDAQPNLIGNYFGRMQAVHLEGQVASMVLSNTFEGGTALYLYSLSNQTWKVSENLFLSNNTGVSMNGGEGGIGVSGNRFIGNQTAWYAYNTSNVVISNNQFLSNQSKALDLTYASNFRVEGNLFDGGTIAMMLNGAADGRIRQNWVSNQGAFGIHATNSTNLVITSNVLVRNQVAFGDFDGGQILLRLNEVTSNQTAMLLQGSGSTLLLELNQIVSNSSPLTGATAASLTNNWWGSTALSVFSNGMNPVPPLAPWRLGPVGLAQADVVPPLKPTNVQVASAGASLVLSWPDMSSTGAVGYRIYRSTNGANPSNFTQAYSNVGNVTSMTDAAPAMTNYYWVTAFDGGAPVVNESWFSDHVMATAPIAAVASNLMTGTPYATIQAGITALASGETLAIFNGVHGENLSISGKTNVVLTSMGWVTNGDASLTTLTGSGVGILLSNAQQATLRGFRVQGFGTGVLLTSGTTLSSLESMGILDHAQAGVRLAAPGASNSVMGATFTGNQMALLISNAQTQRFLSNQLYSNQTGFWVQGSSNLLLAWNTLATNFSNAMVLTNTVSSWISSNEFRTNNTNNSVNMGALILATATGNTVVSNAFLGNRLGLSFGNYMGFSSNNLVSQNLFGNNGTGLYMGNGGVSNQIHQNGFLWNNYGLSAQSSKPNFYSNNTVLSLNVGVDLSYGYEQVFHGNVFSGGSTGLQVFVGSSNRVTGNAFSSNGSAAIQVGSQGVALANVIASNHFTGLNLPNGIQFFSASSNTVTSNFFSNVTGIALLATNSTNLHIFQNTFLGSGTAVSNHGGVGQNVLLNVFSNSVNYSLSGNPLPQVLSNHFGTRTWSNFKVQGVGTVDPWLLTVPERNGDVTPPAPLTVALSTNGLPGQVLLHWGPTSAAGDFSSYRVFATTNNGAYSNLSASDMITNVTSSATTNLTLYPPASGTWSLWVTVVDTNGLESWYSPTATVAYSAPALVASNTATAMAYTSVQAAVLAATNNYTVLVLADVAETIQVDGRTNLTVTSGAGRKTLYGTGAGIGIRLTNSAMVRVSNLILSNFQTGIHGYQTADLTVYSNRLSVLAQGLVVTGSSNAILSNEWVNVTHGITLLGGGQHLVAGNDVFGNFVGAGLAMTNSASNRVSENSFRSHSNGLLVWGPGSFSNHIESNHIRGNQSYGLFLTTSAMSNRIIGNLIASNTTYGVLLSSTPLNRVEGNLILANTNAGLTMEGGFGNIVVGNEIRGPGQNFNLYVENGERSGMFSNNTLLNATQWGIYLGSASNHVIFSNRISGNGTYGIEGAGSTSQSNQIVGNYVHGNAGQGISLGTGAQKTLILSNLIMNNGQYGIHLLTSAPHSILIEANTVLSNTTGGVVIQGASNITVQSNRISGSVQAFGIRVSTGSANALIRSNVIFANQTTGLSLLSVTNAVVEMNDVSAQPTGITNDAGFGNLFRYNLSTNQTVNFASSTATVAADSNWYGSRTWTNLKVFGSATNAPWLLSRPGISGDFLPPPAPGSILVTNGVPGAVVLHWGPASAATDFSNYAVFASSNLTSFSNLTGSDIITNLFSSTTTNVVLFPPSASATWNLWVTASDTNGNESWYSPMATIVFTPPLFVASNTNTLTLYTSIQAAVNAAGTNETILVDQGTFEGSLSLAGKTNLNLIAWPWLTNNNSMGSVINGGGTNTTGILLSNTVGSRIAGFAIGLHSNGIVIYGNSSNNLIDHNIVLSNEQYGLRLSSDSADGNVIASNQFWGLNQDFGMDLFDGDQNLILSNRIGPNQTWGISMWGSTTGNRILGNDIVSNPSGGIANNNGFSQGNSILSNAIWGLNQAYGIVLDAGDNNRVAGNRIYSNQNSGIRVWNSGGHQISSNEIFNNGTHGVHLGNNNVQNVGVSNNAFWGTAQVFAVRVDDGDHNLITLNSMLSNKSAGVWLSGSATNNRIILNNLVGNPTNLSALDTNFYQTNYFGSRHFSVILSNVVNTNSTNALAPWRLGMVGISQGDVTAPAVPTGLFASPTPSNIVLSWNDMSGSGAVSYHIYRSPLTNTFTNFYGVHGQTTGTVWTDSAPSSNTIYHYFVTSVDDPGTVWSNESFYSAPVASQMQDLTLPTANLTNVSPWGWITNANQTFSGWASNASVGLGGVLFGTNLSSLSTATGTTNWSTVTTLSGLDGMTNVFALVVTNLNGLGVTNYYTNRIDLTPPVLSFGFTYDNQNWGGVTNLSGTIAESPMSPLTYVSLEAVSNGVVKTNLLLPTVAGAWSTNLDTTTLVSGLYTLRFTVSNEAGWTNRIFATNINISNFNGTLTWLQPTNGSVLSGVTIMTGYVSAPQSGVFMSNTATGGWVPLTMTGGSNGSTNWNTALWPDGTNTLWVGATNMYGGWYGLGSVWVVVDHSPPVAAVTNPSPDAFPTVAAGRVTFSGTWTDPQSGVAGMVTCVSNSLSNLPALAVLPAGAGEWTNTLTVTTLADGPVWVYLSATNGVGLVTNTTPTRFYLNQYPPLVAETNTAPYSWITNTVDLRGVATNRFAGFDPQTVTIFTNGVAAGTGVGTNWTYSLAANLLPEGTNWFMVQVVSTNALTNLIVLTNRIDTTPPALSFAGALDNGTFTGSTNLNGAVSEMAEDPITFLQLSLMTNGVVYSNMSLTPATGAWSTNLNVAGLPYGFYDLRLSVSNQAGLTNRIFATNILFNNFTGTLVMVSPTNGALRTGVTILTGYVTAPSSGMFASNATSGGWQPMNMVLSNGSLSLNTATLPDGSNQLFFSATNTLGVAFGGTNIWVVVDNSPATSAITNLSAGTFLEPISTFQQIQVSITEPHSGVTGSLFRLSNSWVSSYLSLVPDGAGGATNGWNVSTLPDGPYWLWVEVTNGVGAVSQSAVIQTWLNRKGPIFAETNTSPYALLTGSHTFRGWVTNAYPGYDNGSISLLTNGVAAGNAVGTNWSIPVDTALLPDGTNFFTFRSISTNGITNLLVLTNLLDNSPPVVSLTNPLPGMAVYGVTPLSGRNTENHALITGWEWATNGAPWVSVASNTNGNWAMGLDVAGATNGPLSLQIRVSNHLGLTAVSNYNLLVSNNLPTVSFTGPGALAWITNSNEVLSGVASSHPAPLTSILFSHQVSGPWDAPLGAAPFTTNGPWGFLDRTTNTFHVWASNSLGGVTTNRTYLFDLKGPAVSMVNPSAGQWISNVVAVGATVDSWSPLTHLSLAVKTGASTLLQTNVLPLLTGTNLSWNWDTSALTNGSYDLVLTLTNGAGWGRTYSATGLLLTNTTPLVLTYVGLSSSNSNAVVGVSVPFSVTLFDQYTNLFPTNGAVNLFFAGLQPSPGGDLPTVNGSAMGAPVAGQFIGGVATNLSYRLTRAGGQTLVLAPSFPATNVGPLPLVATGAAPDAGRSVLTVTPVGGSLSTPLTNRVHVMDAFSNAAGSAPTFVFLRLDQSNVSRRDLTLDPVASNEYAVVHTVVSNPGRYVLSAYFDAITEADRVKVDRVGTVDGWVPLDLYGVSSSNLESLIDRNKGGPTVARNPVNAGQDVDLFYRGATGQTVTFIIYDLGGRVLRQATQTGVQDGLQFISIPTRDAKGRELPPGLYFVLMRTENPKSEKTFKLVISR